jgi:hypothetical protein
MDHAVTRTGDKTSVRRPDRWTITHTAGEHFATVFDATGALVDAVQVVVNLASAVKVDAAQVIDTLASAVPFGGPSLAPNTRPVTVKADDLSDVKVEDLSDALAKYALGADRIRVSYWCPRGHESKESFAADVVIPDEWDCPRCGLPSGRNK